MKKNYEAKIKLKPEDISIGDTVSVCQDGFITKQMVPYRVEPCEIIAKRGVWSLLLAKMEPWLEIYLYSIVLTIRSNNHHKRTVSHEQLHLGYDSPDSHSEKRQMAESPVQLGEVNTQSAVLELPIGLPAPKSPVTFLMLESRCPIQVQFRASPMARGHSLIWDTYPVMPENLGD